MRYVGLDVGFGYTKAMDGTKAILFPSVISPAVELKFKSLEEHPAPYPDHLMVTLDGEDHFVGNLALHEGRFTYATLDRVRIQTPEYRLLFLTALSLCVQSPGEELSVVTGLPVDDYDDRDLIEETLSGRFQLTVGGQEVSLVIRRLIVVPQPCGAYMDLAFRDTLGHVNEGYSQSLVGIIDIGHKTTDFVLVQQNRYVEKLSGSIKHGMSTVYQAALSKLSAAYRGNWDLHSAEDVIRKGVLCRLGEQIPVDPLLFEPDLAGLAQEMTAWIQQRWRDQPLDGLMCTGGGSLLLKSHLLKAFPGMVFMEDPQQANVRGFYKGAWYFYG
jgi:plasmid segregation protein ParM